MLTPANIETLYSLGHALMRSDREIDAVHVFRTMLMAAPNDERSWLGLGLAHERLGYGSEAASLYELGEALIACSFRCPLARARLLSRTDTGAAEAAYERAEERALEVDDALARAIAAERRAL